MGGGREVCEGEGVWGQGEWCVCMCEGGGGSGGGEGGGGVVCVRVEGEWCV